MKRVVLALVLSSLALTGIQARDPGDVFARKNPNIHKWMEGLRSGKGPCCSDADGIVVDDPDWKVQHKKIGGTTVASGSQPIYSDYAVLIDSEWQDVPPDAVITEPNLIGKTMVWPIKGYLGTTIRCFMPGSES